jgi:transcriptional antiterminator RfaH
MPILLPEPDRFPADLFAPEALVRTERVWWVLHTKPRQEKSLARHLLQARAPFYLPCIGKRSLIRGRLFTSHVPLFTSYLFLLANRPERIAALATKRVVHALEVTDQTALWRDLDQVSRLISLGLPISPEEKLEAGDLVEVSAGPLAGLRGTVLRAASGRRFVVQVDFIQKGASILLDACNLIPLERPDNDRD